MKKLFPILITLISVILFASSCKKDKTEPVPELPTVLVMGSENNDMWIVDVKNKIDSTYQFSLVDTFNIHKRVPTLSLLNEYDAVLVFTDYTVINEVSIGDTLAAYINGGGGVVTATFTGNVPITGAFEQYALLKNANQKSGVPASMDVILDPNHPILENVLTFNGGTSSYHNTQGDIAVGAVIVAKYDDGEPLILVKENVGPLGVNMVFLNLFPPSVHSRDDFWDVSTDGDYLMSGALLWVSGK